jgi:cAMP-dependent protein kinase regulator
MSQPAPSWNDLLSELNSDVQREQPSDLVQWGADWFQARLRKDVSSFSLVN